MIYHMSWKKLMELYAYDSVLFCASLTLLERREILHVQLHSITIPYYVNVLENTTALNLSIDGN